MKQLHSTILLIYVSSTGDGGRRPKQRIQKEKRGATIYLLKREKSSLKWSLITPRLEPMNLLFLSECTAKISLT